MRAQAAGEHVLPKFCDEGSFAMLAAAWVDGKLRAVGVGQSGNVPASLSQCLPATSAAHYSIVIDQAGGVTLNSLNVTIRNEPTCRRQGAVSKWAQPLLLCHEVCVDFQAADFW